MPKKILITVLLLACLASCATLSNYQLNTAMLGIIKGPDRGQSGNNNDDIFNSLTISPTTSETIYLGSEGNGIFKSTDGGENWTWLRSGLYYEEHSGVTNYPEIYEMVIDPNNENTIYAATVGGLSGGVYKSTDGGSTWNRKISGISNYRLDSIALDPNDSNIIYTGVDGSAYQENNGGIYKSTNSGESFSLITTLPTHYEKCRYEKIYLTSSDKVFALGVNQNNTLEAVSLIKSTDAGQSWTSINPSGTYIEHFDISSSNNNLIYALEIGTMLIYKSTNEGTSWTEISVPYTGGTIKISPHDEDTIFYSNGSGICKSTDGLDNITQVFTLETGSSLFDMVFDSSDPDLIYLAIAHYLVYKSTDGGDAFTQVANLREFIDAQ